MTEKKHKNTNNTYPPLSPNVTGRKKKAHAYLQFKVIPRSPQKNKSIKNQHDPPNHLSNHLSLSLLSHLKTEKFGKKFTPLPQKNKKQRKQPTKIILILRIPDPFHFLLHT